MGTGGIRGGGRGATKTATTGLQPMPEEKSIMFRQLSECANEFLTIRADRLVQSRRRETRKVGAASSDSVTPHRRPTTSHAHNGEIDVSAPSSSRRPVRVTRRDGAKAAGALRVAAESLSRVT